MIGHDTLARYRQLAKYVRSLQEIGPADEEVGNRLLKISEALDEIERLALRSRSKTAEGMRAARGALREIGVTVPAMTRPASSGAWAQPQRRWGSITYLRAGAGPCTSCGEEVAPGPAGWHAEPEPGPLCDGCFRERSPLSMILMLANFVREMGEKECESEDEEVLLGMALLAAGGQIEAEFLRAWPAGKGLPEESLLDLFEEIAERDASASADADAGTST